MLKIKISFLAVLFSLFGLISCSEENVTPNKLTDGTLPLPKGEQIMDGTLPLPLEDGTLPLPK